MTQDEGNPSELSKALQGTIAKKTILFVLALLGFQARAQHSTAKSKQQAQHSFQKHQARQPLAPLTHPFALVSSSTQVVVEFLPFAGVSVFALADDRYRLGMAQIYEVVKNHTDPVTG